jgi:hypothetical protein
MNGGIDQLVDTYKGNPQPLAQKVQKAQQNQPPGEIPADLEEAIALQKIAELRNSAQGQQAMQAGGAQQSVVEKLRQMLGGMQQQGQMAQAPQQGQMQGQTVMAARGGSIDQLMSNLGQYYAGGGIVAFNGKDGSNVPTEEELEAQRKADRAKIDALARALGETGGEYAGKSMAALADIASLIPRGLAGAADTALIRPARALGANIDYLSPALTPGNQDSSTKTPFYDRYIRAKEGTTTSQVKPTPVPGAPLDAETQKLLNLAATQGQTGVNTNPALKPKPPAASVVDAPAPKPPRPPAANVNAPAAPAAPTKPVEEAMDPMETVLRKSIMDALAKDPEAVRKKAMEQNAQFMGLDALLKPAQDRAAAREARIKEIQSSRQPLWIDALMSANKPTRSGIAGVLQNMAVGAISGKQNYDAEDLKFLDELNKLNSEIDKARIEGRYKDVAAGKDAVKDLIADKKQAEQSGTSLLNTKAVNKSREQTALDNRLSRELIAKNAAAASAQSAAAQLEEKRLRRQQQQQQFLAGEERKWQDTLNRNPDYKKLVDQRSMQERLLYMSTDPKVQEKAQAAVDALNERIAKMLPTAGGGTVNIPPPPKGAVTRVG